MHLLSLTRPALWQVDTKVITRLSWNDFVLCHQKIKLDFCVSGWFELVCRLNIIRLNWTPLRQNYTSLGLEFVLFWIDFLRLHWKCDQVHNPSSVFAVSWTYMNVQLFLFFALWAMYTYNLKKFIDILDEIRRLLLLTKNTQMKRCPPSSFWQNRKEQRVFLMKPSVMRRLDFKVQDCGPFS